MVRSFARYCCLLTLMASPLAAADPLPASVDMRGEFDRLGLTCRSQGSRGTCSLFAVTAIANFEAARQEADPPGRFSEEYLVWAADKATGRYGDQAMFYEAVAGLDELGICADKLFAYQRSGERAAPVDEVVAEAAANAGRWRTHWVKRWDTRNGLDAGQWQALREALASGHPVACGLRWPRRSGVDIGEVPAADEVFDGHSIAFVGYRDDSAAPGGGWLWLRNSRGSQWGESGYGRMSYAYAQAYANDALWIEALPAGAQHPVATWEAEELEVVASDGCEASVERMSRYGSKMWSGRKQLACRGEAEASLTLAFEVTDPGTYRVAIKGTSGPDYGRVVLELDGRPCATPHELYSGRVSPAGRLELAERPLAAGRHELKISVAGKSPYSRGHSFGIDTVELLPALAP
jgi:hypothetical protein